jgi:hypothetical protein
LNLTSWRAALTTAPLPRAADAAHLTEALRRSGALPDGRVREVAVESSSPTLISHITRLRLTYEGAVEAPKTLILKTGLPGIAEALRDAGRREVALYTPSASHQRIRARMRSSAIMAPIGSKGA